MANIFEGLQLPAGSPLDIKTVTDNRTGILTSLLYAGLVVWDTTSENLYVYTGDGTTNVVTDWTVVGEGESGVLTIDYIYTTSGASVSGFILAWDTGDTTITTGNGAAVAASTNLITGDTIEIRDLSTGTASIHRYIATDPFEYGSRAAGPGQGDFILLYTFSNAESTARIAGDQALSDEITSLTFDTLASHEGIKC